MSPPYDPAKLVPSGGNRAGTTEVKGGDAAVKAAMEQLEDMRGMGCSFWDCDHNPFKNKITNAEWRVVRNDGGLEIIAGEDEGRVVARLDADMLEEAKRICILVNREQQEIPVEVIGYGEPGDETFRDWYFGKVRDNKPHFRNLWAVSLRVDLEDGDTIIVWLETELGCYGPGVRTRWDEPAWYVIQAAIELAARHVAEQVAHNASKLSLESGSRLQSAVRHH